MLTRKELAALYKCCVDIIRRMCREVGINHGKLISPTEYQKFRQRWGDPA